MKSTGTAIVFALLVCVLQCASKAIDENEEGRDMQNVSIIYAQIYLVMQSKQSTKSA